MLKSKDLQESLTLLIHKRLQDAPRWKENKSSRLSTECDTLSAERKAELDSYITEVELFGTAADSYKLFESLRLSTRMTKVLGTSQVSKVIMHSIRPTYDTVNEAIAGRKRVLSPWVLHFGAWHESAPKKFHANFENNFQ